MTFHDSGWNRIAFFSGILYCISLEFNVWTSRLRYLDALIVQWSERICGWLYTKESLQRFWQLCIILEAHHQVCFRDVFCSDISTIHMQPHLCMARFET